MPPVIIAGGIAAAGAIGASAIASKGAKSAAKTTQAGTDASIAAQTQARTEANAALAPWQQSGLQANSLLQGALGFGGSSQSLPTAQPMQQQNAQQNALMQAKPWLNGPNGGPAYMQLQDATQQQAGQAPQGQANGQATNDAFGNFLNSTNYNWQLQQGQNALNGGYAGAGTLQSGAAVKAFGDYNQNMARGAYQDWFGSVENMANRGFGAASAQAGVSQNFGNNVSNLNSANANSLANLQIAKANNGASTVGALGAIGANVLGNVLAPTSNYAPNQYGVTPNNAFAGYNFG